MQNRELLQINNLSVNAADKVILSGLNLSLERGQAHAIMGMNGSGKSTLVYALTGHPGYEVTDGSVLFDDKQLFEMSVEKRAQAGLFALFQYPIEIPGLAIPFFLKESYQALTGTKISTAEFSMMLEKALAALGLDPTFLNRSYNEGFSGGEKKRLELLQALLIKPKLLILDEIDSGLDIDALKMVAATLSQLRKECPDMSIILITHYSRILTHFPVDAVHIIARGALVKSGGAELATKLEQYGYEHVSSL